MTFREKNLSCALPTNRKTWSATIQQISFWERKNLPYDRELHSWAMGDYLKRRAQLQAQRKKRVLSVHRIGSHGQFVGPLQISSTLRCFPRISLLMYCKLNCIARNALSNLCFLLFGWLAEILLVFRPECSFAVAWFYQIIAAIAAAPVD